MGKGRERGCVKMYVCDEAPKGERKSPVGQSLKLMCPTRTRLHRHLIRHSAHIQETWISAGDRLTEGPTREIASAAAPEGELKQTHGILAGFPPLGLRLPCRTRRGRVGRRVGLLFESRRPPEQALPGGPTPVEVLAAPLPSKALSVSPTPRVAHQPSRPAWTACSDLT